MTSSHGGHLCACMCVCVCVCNWVWGGAQFKFLFTHAKLAPSKTEKQQLDKTALTPCYVKFKFLSGEGKGPDHAHSECC